MPVFRRVGRPGLVGLAARTAVVAGTASAVSGSMARSQQARAQQEAQAHAFEAQQQQAQMDAAAAAAAQQLAAQQAAAAAAAPAPPPQAAAGGVDIVAELQKLGQLKEAGLLSDDEFSAAKAKLLG
ncbi:SHOCT domain-containing protein [Agromyces protaetiae]|uniref:SHOCT domain-containing protein n=1 Tax=Agromyces protaetiae TaxID=2509455 RepID=A0A4P6FEA7_9MICO|nr:SHOCT domain-containing protein [Agromyces protaetiae]QAY72739.1 SHOCT domain-containing protein [Agromyces protaetiae]